MGLKFSSIYFFSASLNHAFFFGVFNALPVTLHLPRIRRRQEEFEGSFLGGGSQPPKQPTSKRISFDSLFVHLTDRITLS